MRAMILAAGRGQRMRPLTDTRPKPLLEVCGKPLIVWHIERLVSAGITELIVNHAWLGHKIEHLLQDGRQFGACIHYSAERQGLETAGGIARALDFFNNEPFLVVNGDIWCDWNATPAPGIGQALTQHKKQAWLLLADNPDHHAGGDFLLHDSGTVSDLSDRSAGIPLTFTGIGVYDPSLFQDIDKTQPTRLAPVLRAAMLNKQVVGQRHPGRWVDVGTPERLAALNRSACGASG